jgi:hypothetical protein
LAARRRHSVGVLVSFFFENGVEETQAAVTAGVGHFDDFVVRGKEQRLGFNNAQFGLAFAQRHAEFLAKQAVEMTLAASAQAREFIRAAIHQIVVHHRGKKPAEANFAGETARGRCSAPGELIVKNFRDQFESAQALREWRARAASGRQFRELPREWLRGAGNLDEGVAFAHRLGFKKAAFGDRENSPEQIGRERKRVQCGRANLAGANDAFRPGTERQRVARGQFVLLAGADPVSRAGMEPDETPGALGVDPIVAGLQEAFLDLQCVELSSNHRAPFNLRPL